MEFTLRTSWMTDNLTIYRIGDKVRVEMFGYDSVEGTIEDLDDATMWLAINGEKPAIIIDMEEIIDIDKLD